MDAFEMFELEKLRPLIERCQLQEHRCIICGSPTTGFGVFTPDNERNFRLQGISQIPQQDYTAAKIKHPKKVLSISFITDNQPAEVL